MSESGPPGEHADPDIAEVGDPELLALGGLVGHPLPATRFAGTGAGGVRVLVTAPAEVRHQQVLRGVGLTQLHIGLARTEPADGADPMSLDRIRRAGVGLPSFGCGRPADRERHLPGVGVQCGDHVERGHLAVCGVLIQADRAIPPRRDRHQCTQRDQRHQRPEHVLAVDENARFVCHVAEYPTTRVSHRTAGVTCKDGP